ncbi:DEAD-box ATP-dependent RNA helicase 39-like [Phragmites australis]|uniref:DEAD-box ATP-dependent RNA helicase 39-like n=1 Tax=Phragmites australis TaxID=29695 RepID=UPI002D790793|nr:DEAD-box ATP-dependent RNA helicase 39-like [Phragmites australis]
MVMAAAGRCLLLSRPAPLRLRLLRAALSTAPILTASTPHPPPRHELLLERLRLRHLKDASPGAPKPSRERARGGERGSEHLQQQQGRRAEAAESFEELGLGEEVMTALGEMGISKPTEIQCVGVPAVLTGTSVVLGSHTGSGKTLAYLLPLVQLLRRDEAMLGMSMKPRRPRAVVLCPTRELTEQVYRVAKSISHHARFRSTMVSGGTRLRPQEDSLNIPVDMVVGTPGRILDHIKDGNIVYGDIKYLVLDEADTMFDQGFGPDIRKFLAPLKNRAAKPGDQGFQTVLVAATMTKAVQKLIDEEFEGIVHLRTSSFQKRVATARHDFIKLSGAENKLEALLQVLEPSLAKGNKVMVFCNTLNSSRAVDHFLTENQISTVNYHGEVPAEERVENLNKFRNEEGDCPTLVCTDLAARGLDLDVDHVIMFDFPSNSIDYLHRTGRTARMGAKGKVTSLIAKKDVPLATRIEEAIKKNESLEALTTSNVRRATNPQNASTKGRTSRLVNSSSALKVANQKGRRGVVLSSKSSRAPKDTSSTRKRSPPKSQPKATKSAPAGKAKVVKSAKNSVKVSKSKSKPVGRKSDALNKIGTKLSVVGFRGRSSGKSAQAS